MIGVAVAGVDYDVGAGHASSVQPEVIGRRQTKCHLFVLASAAAHPNQEAVD